MDTPATEICVDLLMGAVRVCGAYAPMRPAEAAVVFALAADERPIARDLLAEMLYPDADGDRAVNAVKVNASRARRRLGHPEAIRCTRSSYALGWCVDVELPRLEATVRRVGRGEFGLNDRRVLETIRERGRVGRPGFVLKWDWFGTIERRLLNLVHDAGIFGAQDALVHGRYAEAIELASEILRDDPIDESAAEIVLRACVACGDHIGAVLFYRRFAEALMSQMSVLPPPFFRLLFDDPGATSPSFTSFRPALPIAAPKYSAARSAAECQSR